MDSAFDGVRTRVARCRSIALHVRVVAGPCLLETGRGPATLKLEVTTHQMRMPPETSIRCALTQRLSSDSSEAIIGPISSG